MKTSVFPVPVLRLLSGVLFACALAASPASAQEKPKESDIIRPRNAVPADAPATSATKSGDSNYVLIVLAAGAAAAGGWMLWRQRRTPGGIAGRDARKLTIAESRSLGNRQYLVVADYEGKKFLLGVCPGSISMLQALDADERDPRD
ncbi:MAG: flagellar biosynthetic protein FliO [Candidatus Didemnitutus sp.]|nr:flagellar biosynthetic protein FliO [Candidatus Didemnitutus sp.]